MFERFTRQARAVVIEAEAQARALGDATIEAEHLVLAMTREDPPTAARSALGDVGLDHDALEEALVAERDRSLAAVGISAGDFDVYGSSPAGRPRMAASAKAALERALRISLVRADRRIGAGHILLGVLQAEAGTVPRALAQAGVERDDLRSRVEAALDRERGR